MKTLSTTTALRILLLIAAILPFTRVSAHDFEVDGIYYNINGNEATVTYRGTNMNNGYSGDITIPPTVTYNDTTYSVTSIGNYAFYNCSAITSVAIPNSVNNISNNAFYWCIGLRRVIISDLEAWCNISFGDSNSNPLSYAHHLYLNGLELTNLIIPNSITTIRNHTFTGCRGLTSVSIPNSVTHIGAYAFSACSGLTNITIPNSVTSIGNNAFYYCSGLTSTTIPNSVTSIGNNAFDGCSGLIGVNITDLTSWCNISFGNSNSNPLSYAHHLYLNGSEVTELIIPNTVTSIASYAFSGCSALTSVSISNSVNSIGSYAFSGCI